MVVTIAILHVYGIYCDVASSSTLKKHGCSKQSGRLGFGPTTLEVISKCLTFSGREGPKCCILLNAVYPRF